MAKRTHALNSNLNPGCDELELGLARVHGGVGESSGHSGDDDDPMNVALCRLDDSLRTVKSGYLWKLSRSVGHRSQSSSQNPPSSTSPFVTSKWSRRWFILRADSCLYFSKRDTDARPLGAIMVSDCQVDVSGTAEGGEEASGQEPPRMVFRLKLASTCGGGSSSGHHNQVVCLATEDTANLNQWVQAIKLSSMAPDIEDDLWIDITRQRMLLSPAEFPSPDARGFLLKLDGVSKTWKRRYCLLADAFLILYTDFDATSAIASLCLHGYRVQSTGGLSGSKRHAFELIPPDMAASLSSTHAELKNFYFVAETETEKKRWLASLEYSMDRWMKMS